MLLNLSLSLMLQPTVSRPVYLGIKHPSGAYDQIFITVRQFRVCWCGALSLTRRRICRLQLLLALASAVILGSESRGTRYHILLSQIQNFPFRRLLRLSGLRWRYSASPPHGSLCWSIEFFFINTLHGLHLKHRLLFPHIVLDIFTALLHGNGRGADHIENNLPIAEACIPRERVYRVFA
jgi:hypothetical protein